MSTYKRQKKRVVLIYSARMTDNQIKKFMGANDDRITPPALINGVLFDLEQRMIRYNVDIGGKLR